MGPLESVIDATVYRPTGLPFDPAAEFGVVFAYTDDHSRQYHKYVHVDGNVRRHRFLRVPVGTPASALLDAAGEAPRSPPV
jgi:hypothetical protein